jgi:hypothetical protein
MHHIKSAVLLSLLISHLAFAEETKFDNPYTQHYKERVVIFKSATAEAPRVFRGTNRETDYNRLLEDGYDQLGTSAFQTFNVEPEKLTEHAQKVHADLALVYTNTLGKQSMDAKIAAAKAKAKSKEQPEKAPGEGRLLEFEQPRYDYYATFWTKLPPPLLGLHVSDRKEDDKRPGVPVVAVVKDSPAATAGLRKGDVVLKVSEVETNNGDAFVQTIRSNAGKPVEIVLLREDVLVAKTVTLNAK